MFYTLDGNAITITDMQDFKVYQEKDPTTQKYFTSPEEALAWGKSYLSQSINCADFIGFDVKLTPSTSTTVLDHMTVGTRCRIRLNEQSGMLQDEYYISLYHFESCETFELTFSFVDGAASATFLPKLPGSYVLLMNGPFIVDDVEHSIFDDLSKFTFTAQ